MPMPRWAAQLAAPPHEPTTVRISRLGWLVGCWTQLMKQANPCELDLNSTDIDNRIPGAHKYVYVRSALTRLFLLTQSWMTKVRALPWAGRGGPCYSQGLCYLLTPLRSWGAWRWREHQGCMWGHRLHFAAGSWAGESDTSAMTQCHIFYVPVVLATASLGQRPPKAGARAQGSAPKARIGLLI